MSQTGKASLSKLNTTQLQQRVIHYQAEMNKYKTLVDQYQNNYHYNLIDTLKSENDTLNQQLITLKEQLTEEKEKANRVLKEVAHLKEIFEQKQKILIEEKRQLEEQLNQQTQSEKEKNHLTETEIEQEEKQKEKEHLSNHSSNEGFPFFDTTEPIQKSAPLKKEQQNDDWFFQSLKNFSIKKKD